MAASVSFLSDNLRLAGELHLPDSPRPYPGLCVCHGIPAVPYNPDDTGYHDLAVRFSAAGFATLLFNMRGAGLSEGDFDLPGWTRDISAAIDYLADRADVDASRIFLMGFSGGAAAGIYRAAHDSRIAGVVACASPAHFGELTGGDALASCLGRWREIGIIRNPGFPPDMERWASGFREVAPIDHVASLAPRPLLLLQGDADEVVNVSHAHQLFRAAGRPKELIVLPGGVHRLRVDERAMSAALKWLRSHSG